MNSETEPDHIPPVWDEPADTLESPADELLPELQPMKLPDGSIPPKDQALTEYDPKVQRILPTFETDRTKERNRKVDSRILKVMGEALRSVERRLGQPTPPEGVTVRECPAPLPPLPKEIDTDQIAKEELAIAIASQVAIREFMQEGPTKPKPWSESDVGGGPSNPAIPASRAEKTEPEGPEVDNIDRALALAKSELEARKARDARLAITRRIIEERQGSKVSDPSDRPDPLVAPPRHVSMPPQSQHAAIAMANRGHRMSHGTAKQWAALAFVWSLVVFLVSQLVGCTYTPIPTLKLNPEHFTRRWAGWCHKEETIGAKAYLAASKGCLGPNYCKCAAAQAERNAMYRGTDGECTNGQLTIREQDDLALSIKCWTVLARCLKTSCGAAVDCVEQTDPELIHYCL